MYQLSPYTYQTENNKGEVILADIYNSNIYKVSKEKKNEFLRCVNNPNEKSKLQNFFIDRKVFFDKKMVNSNYKKKLYTDYIFSKESLELIILPTESCNFRCSYCYEEYAKGSMSEETQEGIVKYVRENIAQYAFLRVSWFGGEPLSAIPVINKLSEALRAVCKEYKKPYHATMTTNGYNLNLEIFKSMFKKNRVTHYQITIDGLKVTHDLQRKLANHKGSFDVILNNLKGIRDNVKSNLFIISIRCNITNDVYKNFDQYVNFIEEEFGDDKRFEFIWRIAWNPKGEVDEEGQYCENIVLTKILEKYKGRKLRIEADRTNFMCYGGICYAASKNNFVIGSDGTVYKCTVAFKDEGNRIGKVYADGTMEIDESKYKFWTEQKECMELEQCESCLRYPACLGMYCPKSNVSDDGKFICDKETFMEMDSYLQYYSEIENLVEDVSNLI